MKRVARREGVDVIEVTTLKAPDTQQRLKDLGADLFVIAAFGLILPPEVLDIPPKGCLNVHLSLLPELRGAAPAEWAIVNGSAETGVSIMVMDEGLDTGPVLDQTKVDIGARETGGELLDRLAALGSELLVDVLGRLDHIEGVAQDDSKATYAPIIKTADAEIDWRAGADEIDRRVRGFNPKPGAWTTFRGRRLKVLQAEPSNRPRLTPGVLGSGDNELVAGTGSSPLRLLEVQMEGRKPTDGPAFARGARIDERERLGSDK